MTFGKNDVSADHRKWRRNVFGFARQLSERVHRHRLFDYLVRSRATTERGRAAAMPADGHIICCVCRVGDSGSFAARALCDRARNGPIGALSHEIMRRRAEPGARANTHIGHASCLRTSRARCACGSSLTFGKRVSYASLNYVRNTRL